MECGPGWTPHSWGEIGRIAATAVIVTIAIVGGVMISYSLWRPKLRFMEQRLKYLQDEKNGRIEPGE